MKAMDLPSGDHRGHSNLQRRLVDGFHQAGGGVEHGEFGDVPVVVAVAERGGDDEVQIVGRPIEFVNVGVGGRDLAEFSGGDVDEGEALLEKGVFDFAGFGSLGDERAGGARRVFSEEDGDGFSVRRKLRSGERSPLRW